MGQEKRDSTMDVRHLFGYYKGSDWVKTLNIGSIMQLSPMTMQECMSNYNPEYELTREILLEKIALLSVAYFCISTEKRFLSQEGTRRNVTAKQSEFWHAKALEMAYCFLPHECPLVNHIYVSYQKHYAPLQQPIV